MNFHLVQDINSPETHIRFTDITEITQPNTTNKPKFQKPKRRRRTVSRSFSPPETISPKIVA
jgi:hypothetical protein